MTTEAVAKDLDRMTTAFSQGPSYVDIMVPANSAASGYASKIHDQKGRSWQQRGPGTVAKGPQADEKFIARAITTLQPRISEIFTEATAAAKDKKPNPIGKALRQIGLIVQREARRNAPRSPTIAQLKRAQKSGNASSFYKKIKVSTYRPVPGTLERSIVFEVG